MRDSPDKQVLRRSEELLRLALHGAHAGAWVVDLDGNETYWNEELDHLYGFDPTERPSFERWTRSLHPDDRQRVLSDLEARLESEVTDFEREFRIIHPTQGIKWILNKGSVARDTSGKPRRIHGIDSDITDRKQAEEALQEADRRKDEFLAILAHELRNPLTPLRNSIEILRLAENDSASANRAIETMDRQLRHLVHIVDELLDINRLRHGKMSLKKSRVRVLDVIEQAVETSHDFITQCNNELIVHLPPATSYISADLTRLVQVVSNLLNNAAKFTGPGGCIWLTVRTEPGEVVISVKDNGIGVAPDQLSRLFDMFDQLTAPIERNFGGMGVGLALVRGLIDLHGGSVEARSEGLNRGTEFIVRLPTAESADNENSRQENESAQSDRGLRILVVDDNQDSAVSMAAMLDLINHETRTAFDGLAAIELAEQFRPDVIFLDIGMPSPNGYEVARRIRREAWGHDVLLVAVTGWGQDEDRQRSKEAGFDLHLVKPVELAAVREILNDRGSPRPAEDTSKSCGSR